MKNDKTQPQELLEEVIGITHGDKPQYPSFEEQQEYWRQRDLEENRAEVDPDAFTCMTCKPERKFKSAQALRMHVARVHTKTVLAPKEKLPPPTAEDNHFAAQTAANAPAEKRVPRPDEWDYGMSEIVRESRKQSPAGGVKKQKWSLARRRKFNAKKKAQQDAILSLPKSAWGSAAPDEPEVHVPTLKYCPSCGEHLEGWKHAG
jgi:hypothetical protein